MESAQTRNIVRPFVLMLMLISAKLTSPPTVSSLPTLLPTFPALHTLTLTITPPDALPSKSILASLLPLERALPALLASLPASLPVTLAFDFEDCFCRMRVEREQLRKDFLLVWACQVLFWKSHLRVEAMVRESRGGKLVVRKGRVDLGPLVGEGVAKVVEVGREGGLGVQG